ncbi:hypothetical protein Zmor_014116 [Zophobas morio]|uniref:TTF-type domain-containing protein n=1 Tax=Zophobas morio TaxID=2755281 RepID=A0AA38MGA5_9CUCU|nr:hypothetical protein Zmor_014116 [Zophobas morio]
MKNKGSRGNRGFNNNWYDKYNWLTGSEKRNKLYCWSCLLFSETKQSPWTSGYDDLKHLSESLQKHGNSEQHTHASLKFKLFGKNNIQDSIDSAHVQSILKHNELVKENREIITRLIDMIIYLATQEQAFRGHNESRDSLNQGNFRELASLLSKYDNKFKVFLDESSVFTGLSKTIQNELIESINKVISEIIENEIKMSPFFSWQVDETTDINCRSQVSVIFRYVKEGKAVERFMGFFDASEGRTAADLFNLLTENFSKYDITNKLIGQTYDGASVMSGELNGLQSRVKQIAPQALFTHCYAHRLNLILQDASTSIKECRFFCKHKRISHIFF